MANGLAGMDRASQNWTALMNSLPGGGGDMNMMMRRYPQQAAAMMMAEMQSKDRGMDREAQREMAMAEMMQRGMGMESQERLARDRMSHEGNLTRGGWDVQSEIARGNQSTQLETAKLGETGANTRADKAANAAFWNAAMGIMGNLAGQKMQGSTQTAIADKEAASRKEVATIGAGARETPAQQRQMLASEAAMATVKDDAKMSAAEKQKAYERLGKGESIVDPEITMKFNSAFDNLPRKDVLNFLRSIPESVVQENPGSVQSYLKEKIPNVNIDEDLWSTFGGPKTREDVDKYRQLLGLKPMNPNLMFRAFGGTSKKQADYSNIVPFMDNWRAMFE